MTSLALPTVAASTLPIEGSAERWPIRRVYCVGRNYADHAREMGSDPDREPPFFFSKPADAVYAASEGIPAGGGDAASSGAAGATGVAPGTTPYPPRTEELHHEVELVVAIGGDRELVDLDPAAALDAVWGYTVGIDLTRRDRQAVAKSSGRPWDLAKGFDASGPVGALVPAERLGHPAAARIHLEVNGATRQDGDLDQQIWSVPEIVAELSREIALRPGDLIFTGTPAGVGPLERGDAVRATIEGVASLEVRVV
ncbi:fumarylacetoacetate hydrolase family protein [Schumannella sp. 10F1B-5-1]|uniref:fumarylacetoacetate hydrolase family protein n=1 Tax=Schumannella sp. 10F1B-5-1 TaxID=2590780 RepID=UPI001131244D|nr:fumarylacetoacetate hydrolase family protein [Schumannella sp. 10F1B-5-1]TPW78307.1 fumarylacetoacetate hydrolase family protein [Schumannella sp. 10F1B-5-1]